MNLEKYMFPCISKTLFGIECLGCGFQRAFVLLLEGNFEAAFIMYPAIYSSLILLLIAGLHFVDLNRNYKKTLTVLLAINGILMIGGYYFKHFV
ncbi:DUF2752 domain-containing protein [Flavobacterium sp.]|uniref:DUF2752 domain-containing protein n=1 Tax=Flavobacterium sp. TaxID=239 RepID=UPI0008B7B694|nr:DUF2752 domain-containing protein [Flavobacterium sp.]OGS65649.1 MAG: hypothetical protein A2X21_01535 [Flavobacteria bacterium GWA2_35_26]HCF02888.1 hypothetical protein [Flavobacterium sp.]